jgi:regulator of ribosome biosynthesis
MLKDQQGEDDITRDYDKAPDEVSLPKAVLTLPRIMPIPKEKPLTKWEKYKQEKGIHSRKRRRMVWSDIANDWVPRWGKGSIKKIEKDVNWAMEEKETGVNPFDKQKEEQNLKKQKQEMRHLKNQINAAKTNGNENKTASTMSKKARKGMKIQKEIQRLDQDKKNLSKRLEQVQKSTRSMGHFDKKVKNEKELNIIKKKKVDTDVLLNRKHERSRDKAIMESILNKK